MPRIKQGSEYFVTKLALDHEQRRDLKTVRTGDKVTVLKDLGTGFYKVEHRGAEIAVPGRALTTTRPRVSLQRAFTIDDPMTDHPLAQIAHIL